MNRKNINIVIILAIVVILVFLGLGFFGLGGFSLGSNQAPQQSAGTAGDAQSLLTEVQKTGSVTELKSSDIVVGNGDPIAPGDTIEVSYTGVLPNGTVFDSTEAHGGTPLTLVVAADGSLHTPEGGSLIQGWSLGMAGMKEGGQRLLAIPSELGYGPNAVGQIPANSTLIFEVQVLKRTPGGTAQ